MAPSTQLEIRLSCMALSVFPAGPPPLLLLPIVVGRRPFVAARQLYLWGWGTRLFANGRASGPFGADGDKETNLLDFLLNYR